MLRVDSTGNAWRSRNKIMIRISLIIAGLYAGSSALADETDLNPGWIITDVSECLEASSRGVFVDYKSSTAHVLKFEMGGKGYGAVCGTSSYRFFYKEREYNLVSINGDVPPELSTDQIPADAYETLQDKFMELFRNNYEYLYEKLDSIMDTLDYKVVCGDIFENAEEYIEEYYYNKQRGQN